MPLSASGLKVARVPTSTRESRPLKVRGLLRSVRIVTYGHSDHKLIGVPTGKARGGAGGETVREEVSDGDKENANR